MCINLYIALYIERITHQSDGRWFGAEGFEWMELGRHERLGRTIALEHAPNEVVRSIGDVFG